MACSDNNRHKPKWHFKWFTVTCIFLLYCYLQILMSVLTQVKITVVLMLTALTLLEVMTAPARLDTQEMGTHVMVSFLCTDLFFPMVTMNVHSIGNDNTLINRLLHSQNIFQYGFSLDQCREDVVSN